MILGDVTTPILIDCDPGHDDALAILLALARPELQVLGITTVYGNASLERTTRNALRVLTLADRTEIPVGVGADRPLLREPWAPVAVHGVSGLDGADLPEPAVGPWAGGDAIELMAATLRDAAEPVTLIPTGPLTNVALLLRAHPRLRDRIAAICFMGGAIGAGNTTPSAEFNVWSDPEAASIVAGSGIPLTMIGLDVTHQALVLPEDVERLEALGNRAGRVVADLVRFFARHHRERYGWPGPPIHDAVAVATVAMPDLVETRPCRLDVETASDLTRGRTVVDLERRDGREPNAEVGVSIDRARFVDVLIAAIGAVPDRPDR